MYWIQSVESVMHRLCRAVKLHKDEKSYKESLEQIFTRATITPKMNYYTE